MCRLARTIIRVSRQSHGDALGPRRRAPRARRAKNSYRKRCTRDSGTYCGALTHFFSIARRTDEIIPTGLMSGKLSSRAARLSQGGRDAHTRAGTEPLVSARVGVVSETVGEAAREACGARSELIVAVGEGRYQRMHAVSGNRDTEAAKLQVWVNEFLTRPCMRGSATAVACEQGG